VLQGGFIWDWADQVKTKNEKALSITLLAETSAEQNFKTITTLPQSN
jgi:hypothetical protein